MDEGKTGAGFLTVIDVEDGGVQSHLVCMIETDLAQERGIDSRAIVGKFEPDADGEFDPSTFILNTEFLAAVKAYMNERTAAQPMMAAEAARNAGGELYVLDPRARPASESEIDGRDILGCFQVDEAGTIVPDSFAYNDQHRWFDTELGPSGVFGDAVFYRWLHDRGDESDGSVES